MLSIEQAADRIEASRLRAERKHPYRWCEGAGGTMRCDLCGAAITRYRFESAGIGADGRVVCREHTLSPDVTHPRREVQPC